MKNKAKITCMKCNNLFTNFTDFIWHDCLKEKENLEKKRQNGRRYIRTNRTRTKIY